MAAPQASSRLEMLQARFQQKQLQEKEQKLLQLYDQQQQRAYQVVQRGSAGSNGSSSSIGHQTVTRSSSSNQTTSTTQGGKVRQMFDERRQTSVKGIDRSYPLEPLENKPRKQTTNGTLASQRNAGTLTVNRESVTVKRQGRADLNSNLNTYHHEEVHTRETYESTTERDEDEEEFGDENDLQDRYPNGNERHENHHQVLDQDTIDNNRMMAKLHLMEFDETMKHRIRNDLESEEFPEELMVEVPDKMPKRTATRKLSQAEARLERFKNANAKRGSVLKNSTSIARKPTTTNPVKSTPRRSQGSPTGTRRLDEGRGTTGTRGPSDFQRKLDHPPNREQLHPGLIKARSNSATRRCRTDDELHRPVGARSTNEESSKKPSRESSRIQGGTCPREIASPKKDSISAKDEPRFLQSEKSSTTFSLGSRNPRVSGEYSVKDSRKTETSRDRTDSGKTRPEFFCVESEKSATTYSLRPSEGSRRPEKVQDRAKSGRSMKLIQDPGTRVTRVESTRSPALKRTPVTSILKKGQDKKGQVAEAELRGLEVIKKIKETAQRKLRATPGPRPETKGKPVFPGPKKNGAKGSPDKTSRPGGPVKGKPETSESSEKDRAGSRTEFFCVESERSATTFLRPETRRTPDRRSSPDGESWRYERMEDSCSRTLTPDSLLGSKRGTASPELGHEENDRSGTSFGWRPETIEKRRMSEVSGRSSRSETVERAKTPTGRFYLHEVIPDDESKPEVALRGIFEKKPRDRSLESSRKDPQGRTNGESPSPVLRSVRVIREITKGQSRTAKLPEEGSEKPRGFEEPREKELPEVRTASPKGARGRGSFLSITEMDEDVQEVVMPGRCPERTPSEELRTSKSTEIGRTYSRADNDRLRPVDKAEGEECSKETEDARRSARSQKVQAGRTYSRVRAESSEEPERVSFATERPARKRSSVLRSNVFEPTAKNRTSLSSKISNQNFDPERRRESSEPRHAKEKGTTGTVKRSKSSIERSPELARRRGRNPETKGDLLRSSGAREKGTLPGEVAGTVRKSSTGDPARPPRSMELVRSAMSKRPGQKIARPGSGVATSTDVRDPRGGRTRDPVLVKKSKPIAKPLERILSARSSKTGHFKDPPLNKVKLIQSGPRSNKNVKGTTDKSGMDVVSELKSGRYAKSLDGAEGCETGAERISRKSLVDQEIVKQVAVYSSEEETLERRTCQQDRYQTVSRRGSVSRYSSISSTDKLDSMVKLTKYREERTDQDTLSSFYERTDSVESALKRFDSIGADSEHRAKTFPGSALSSPEIEPRGGKCRESKAGRKDSTSECVKAEPGPVSLKALDQKSSLANGARKVSSLGSRVQESRTKIAKDPARDWTACRRKLFEDSDREGDLESGHVEYSSFSTPSTNREKLVSADKERGRTSSVVLPPVRQLRSIEDIRRSIRKEEIESEPPRSAIAKSKTRSPSKTPKCPENRNKTAGSMIFRNGVTRLSRTVKSPSPDSTARKPTETSTRVSRRSIPPSPTNSPDAGPRRSSTETKTTRRPPPGRGPEVPGKKSTIRQRSTDVVDGPVHVNGVETRDAPAKRPDTILIEAEDGSSRETETAATRKPSLRKQSLEKQGSPTQQSRPVSSISSISSGSSNQGQTPGSRARMATRATRTPTSGAASSRTAASGRIAGNASAVENLVPCKMCGRRFAQERVSLHEQICSRTAQKKRKQFDAMLYRVRGTDLEPFVKKGVAKKQPEPKPKKPELRSNWRKKHEEFINAIRSAKQVQAHLAAGGKLSDLPPPPASDTSDYIQCPHCGRRFNQAAAERHIPKCEHMLHNKPRPPKTKR